MTTITISDKPTHTQRLVDAFAKSGWRALVLPSNGKLNSNRQVIEFRTSTTRMIVRFSIFAVADRGESHRRDERRIQITTTYLSGLRRPNGFRDIVLGYDTRNDVYVGLDARRLEFGGKHHNASSSIDAEALEHAPANNILIRPHDTQNLGLEYQAVFRPQRLTEYIFNVDSIHRGLYVGDGSFSDSTKTKDHAPSALTVPPGNAHGEVLILEMASTPRAKKRVSKSQLAAFEKGDWERLADLSPEEFEAIRRRCVEIGDRGEYFVFQYEKRRLRKAGKSAFSMKVDWISRRAIGRGYDIKSYEDDGSPRLIEVKATTGKGMTFLMSDKEWRVASREKAAYYIYRIVNVDTTPTLKAVIQNPVAAEGDRILERTATGWRIQIQQV